MNRRHFVTSLAALIAMSQRLDAAAKPEDPIKIDKLKLSDDEWRKRLAPESYAVLRHEATERAGTSPLNNEKRKGFFACAGCDLPLFTSEMKYESGTGWPSFFTVIPPQGPSRGPLRPAWRPGPDRAPKGGRLRLKAP